MKLNFIKRICKTNEVLWNNPRGHIEYNLEHNMLKEELEELKQAITNASFSNEPMIESETEMLDALVDIIYVAVGSMHKLGLTPQQIDNAINIVCDANEAKSGKKNADGKVSKPDNFPEPQPKLKKLLEERNFDE